MVTLHEGKQFIINNDHIASAEEAAKLSEEAAKKETLTWQVLSKHNHSDNMEHLVLRPYTLKFLYFFFQICFFICHHDLSFL